MNKADKFSMLAYQTLKIDLIYSVVSDAHIWSNFVGCNSGKLFNYIKKDRGMCCSLFHTFLQSVHLKIKGWFSNAA